MIKKEVVQKELKGRLDNYDCVVIAEDQDIYLLGVVIAVQEVVRGQKPLYIAKHISELIGIHKQLLKREIKAFYIMDNHLDTSTKAPLGQDLIKHFGIEGDCVMCTSDYDLMQAAPYPVFDKVAALVL